MDRRDQVTMLQLAIMNHRLIMLDDEVLGEMEVEGQKVLAPSLVIGR